MSALMTPEDVQRRTGLSAYWLRAQARAGRFPHSRGPRRTILFSHDDEAAILAEIRQQPQPDVEQLATPRNSRRRRAS